MNHLTEIKENEPDSLVFLEEASTAVTALRRALGEVFEAVGADPAQPQENSRRFDLDKTLTWKIARVLREDDVTAAIQHLPGRRRLQSLLKAMAKAGANSDLVEAAWRAYDQFERIVEVHSGDRDTLDVMVASATNRLADRRFEQFRKHGYLCNSSVWGVRARLQFGMNIMAPSDEPGMLNITTISGLLGFQRLRANVPWAVSSAHSWDYGPEGDENGTTPVDPNGVAGTGVPLVSAFCSSPRPSMRMVRVEGSTKRFEVVDGPVGQGAQTDIVLGWRCQRAPAYEERDGDLGEHGIMASTPAQTVVFDLWAHRSLAFAMNPVARVYSALPSGPRYPIEGREAGRLQMPEEVVSLGAGSRAATMAEYPRFGELLEYAASRNGWNIAEFRGFRYRLKYPPIPILALVQHPLLTRG